MARKIKVSRHGLTRCPACAAHIQLAPSAADTACPFCQARLTTAPEPTGALSGLLRGALNTGRSGLLAASLLGLSVSACGEDEEPPPTEDATSDTEPQPAYGIPADVIEEDVPTASDALYGLPPDDTSDTNPTTAPMYGLPADTSDPDAVEQEVSEDTAGEALYGIPPDDTTP